MHLGTRMCTWPVARGFESENFITVVHYNKWTVDSQNLCASSRWWHLAASRWWNAWSHSSPDVNAWLAAIAGCGLAWLGLAWVGSSQLRQLSLAQLIPYIFALVKVCCRTVPQEIAGVHLLESMRTFVWDCNYSNISRTIQSVLSLVQTQLVSRIG
jgi:hypothetical protein